jgi:hypothetical protein
MDMKLRGEGGRRLLRGVSLVPALSDRKLAVLDVVVLPALNAFNDVNAAVASDCRPIKPRNIQILLKYVLFIVHLL